MTVSIPGRSRASRRRKRRARTKFLAVLAVIACVALMIGRGTAQIVSQNSCSQNPIEITVAVSADIYPPVSLASNTFNHQNHQADGRCIAVTINTMAPAEAAAQVDGQHPDPGNPIDAWIPDSSLWVDEARAFAVGAQNVQPAGYSVAKSPLMIVMPAAAAAQTRAFGKNGWRLLLPQSAGGPRVPANLRVDLPDPSQSAAGLATLIELGRLLGPGAAARVKLTKFVYSAEVTSYFDDPASLSSFVSLAAPPLDGMPVTVTTEQAVLAYDQANPRQPLAASYPSGASPALGSPEMDYPYVLTTSSDRADYSAAAVFGQFLRGSYAQSVIRYAGFRSGGTVPGVPDRFPASYGLASQLLQVAPAAAPVQAPTLLQVWNKLALGSRDLALVDVSGVMGKPALPTDPTGPTIEQVLTKTASTGLALFPDTSQIGLWQFSSGLDGSRPYQPLVSTGPLPASMGLVSRRTDLQRIAESLRPTSQGAALYGTILDAYKYMLKSYQPNYFNSVVVLTAGLESASGDISAQELIKRLTALSNPAKRVQVVIVTFGQPPNFAALQQIAAATGGEAYAITNPSQVVSVFFEAVAHRLCTPGCVAP